MADVLASPVCAACSARGSTPGATGRGTPRGARGRRAARRHAWQRVVHRPRWGAVRAARRRRDPAPARRRAHARQRPRTRAPRASPKRPAPGSTGSAPATPGAHILCAHYEYDTPPFTALPDVVVLRGADELDGTLGLIARELVRPHSRPPSSSTASSTSCSSRSCARGCRPAVVARGAARPGGGHRGRQAPRRAGARVDHERARARGRGVTRHAHPPLRVRARRGARRPTSPAGGWTSPPVPTRRRREPRTGRRRGRLHVGVRLQPRVPTCPRVPPGRFRAAARATA